MFRFAAALSGLISSAFILCAQIPPKLRLPGDVKPLRYALDLRLVPQEDTYSGRISIDIEVTRPTQTVWLNSTDLKITSALVASGTAGQVVSGGREFAGIQFPSALPPGKTRIDIDFTGVFNKRDVEGLFRQSEGGDAYVLTQFEPTSARRAFPCFDEPQYKVPWKLTLHVPKDQGAFSNTPVLSEAPEPDGLKTVRFGETKPMPSYLIAIAVGPFDVADGGKAGKKNVPVRVLAPKGRAAEAAWVNQITPKIVAALEEYFGLPYPYEKLDQASIPVTVAFGAMENAGLITYSQTILLARPQDDTLTRQRRTANTVAHELAHQWFGDLVTPAWWDDIWLNEAFATWMATKITGKLFPEWNSPVAAMDTKAEAMAQDQLISARKIRQPIEDEGDIGNAFDTITYQKGGAVIRMFENYVGPGRFQKGVQNYIRKHMWGNATASDFLASISAASGQNITPLFSKFLDRGGLPLLTVDLKCEGKPELAVTQERSLPLGSKGDRKEYWPVPVCVRYEANGKVSRECTLMTDPKQEIALRAATSCPTWITANDRGSGYYHVLYQGDLADKLIANSGKLSLAEKVDLLRNAAAMVRSGRMAAGDALALARQFRNGPERELIAASMTVVTSVRKSVPADDRVRYAKMIREFYGAKAHELGWQPKPGEGVDAELLRPKLLELVAGVGEDPELATQARQLAEAWLKDRKALQPEIVTAVLSAAAFHGDRALFNQFVAAARASKDRRERGRIIDAIALFRDPAIVRSALGLMLTNDLDIRELTKLFQDVQVNPETERIPWEFVTENYDRLLPRLPTRLGTGAASILPQSGASLCDEAGYRKVEQFFGERIREVSGGPRMLAKVLEGIQLCQARLTAQTPEVSKFLKQYAD